jgi:hypothetical protein
MTAGATQMALMWVPDAGAGPLMDWLASRRVLLVAMGG